VLLKDGTTQHPADANTRPPVPLLHLEIHFDGDIRMAHDRFDWLILLVAGAIASVLLLAMTAYNAFAG
jgi:hypothetical protein